MLSMISKTLSQAYPPNPAFTEENIPDLHGKVRLLLPPKPGRNH